MKLFKITFNCYDYDQYDALIVAAKQKEDVIPFIQSKYDCSYPSGTIDVKSGYVIEELKPENYKQTIVVLESFNAG